MFVFGGAMHVNDGFENGLLVADAGFGQWQSLIPVGPSIIGLDAGATHGFAVHDLDTTATNGPGGRIASYIGLVGTDLYARFWFRMSGPPAGGDLIPAMFTQLPAFQSFFSFYVEQTGRAAMGGFNVDMSEFDYNASDSYVADGGWHLVEMIGSGMGTTQAERHMYVDGLDAGMQTADMDGGSWWGFELGQPWAQPRVT